MLHQEFALMDSLTSHWVVELDITLFILIIVVIDDVGDAVVLVECDFTAFGIHLPNSGVLSDSTFAIFDLFDDIEIFFITPSIRSYLAS